MGLHNELIVYIYIKKLKTKVVDHVYDFFLSESSNNKTETSALTCQAVTRYAVWCIWIRAQKQKQEVVWSEQYLEKQKQKQKRGHKIFKKVHVDI